MSAEQVYSRGPGSSRTRGAVDAVYADSGCLEFDCPDCGQAALSYCVWKESGKQRRSPCGGRKALVR